MSSITILTYTYYFIREENARRRAGDDMRRDRFEGEDIRGGRDLGRPFPPEMRRGEGRPLREDGPARHRSRSPLPPRNFDQRGPDRGKISAFLRFH